jgi:hypothetical protein
MAQVFPLVKALPSESVPLRDANQVPAARVVGMVNFISSLLAMIFCTEMTVAGVGAPPQEEARETERLAGVRVPRGKPIPMRSTLEPVEAEVGIVMGLRVTVSACAIADNDANARRAARVRNGAIDIDLLQRRF